MVNQQKIGSWAFLIGIIIAIIAGAAAAAAVDYPGIEYVPLALVVLGLVVGFVNIADKEIQDFLIAGIALIAIGIPGAALSVIPYVGEYLVSILGGISLFAAPAVLVVALKAFYTLSKEPTLAK
ncbi:MAG: hypothetical protein JW744_01520 [Candidatus Diapherotrites archaeon]|uniref:Uncharacterized protein n=1 Tax=Candidatus Iainarchaeum sp. TaxID=3101447 RepID=A0A939C4E8_9ARCH|nr:hypothetical protein [Candidatus Diapherotrites archaeon]